VRGLRVKVSLSKGGKTTLTRAFARERCYRTALQRDFKEFTTPEDPLHVGEPLSQKKSSCRCAGVVYLSSPFLGAPEEIRELNSPFSRSCDKNGLSLSQNNANALFCLASLGTIIMKARWYTCFLSPLPLVRRTFRGLRKEYVT